MNNIKNKRTGLKLLGSVQNGNYRRFTFNKTQQNQSIYTNVEPRCPGTNGYKAGNACSGSNTTCGCKTCMGCVYSFDVSSNIFNNVYPTNGSYININPVRDNSSNINPPCEWQYNGIVENFIFNDDNDTYDATVTINIESNKCINVNDVSGVYFYEPVGGSYGVYAGYYTICNETTIGIDLSTNMFDVSQDMFATNAKRMGAPYRNPIAGWRKVLECCKTSNNPSNNIYKDNWARDASGGGGCCSVDCSGNRTAKSGIQGRTNKPLIRSGMQPKPSCCKADGTICKNDYSYSYRQYQNNNRCMSYDRSQEKYVRNFPACGMFHGRTQRLNAYRKSSCCDCCEPCSQLIRNGDTGLFIYAPQIGDNAIQTGTGATGIVVSFITGTGQANDIDTVTIQATDCDNLFGSQEVGTNDIVFSGPNSGGYTKSQRTMQLFTIISETIPGSTNNCSNKTMSKTIYKPNNKKYSQQGAVTSGSRLDRLKLNTIRAANSKCIKGKRCIEIPSKFIDINKTYKYPNGKYTGGAPRFVGWMFNGHHREVVNMNKYHQQPLGIPQLTSHPPGNTCIKKCFTRLGKGNRAPGGSGQCPANAVTCNKCGGAQNSASPCGNNPNATGQGTPCCN